MKSAKPKKKKTIRQRPLNLSGIKFEDAVKRLANTPPMPKKASRKVILRGNGNARSAHFPPSQSPIPQTIRFYPKASDYLRFLESSPKTLHLSDKIALGGLSKLLSRWIADGRQEIEWPPGYRAALLLEKQQLCERTIPPNAC